MDDNVILELFWRRNESAISETEKKYKSYCGKIARNILANKSDEEECLSDTWLGAWNSIPPNRPRILSSYLGRITRNLSLNVLKKQGAMKRAENFSVALDELSECIPSAENVEKKEDFSELICLLSGFLKNLRKDERFVFLRRYWYCDSVKTISDGTGFSEGKIKSMLFRTRNSLKSVLEKEGYTV